MGIEMFKSFAKGYDKEVKENKDVWIYTRVSSKDQESNKSLRNQLDSANALAKEKRFVVSTTFGGTYESASGDLTRKEFSKLINAIRSAKTRPYAILLNTISRFSRTGGSAIALAYELVEKLGVHIIEVSTGKSTETEDGKIQVYEGLLNAKKENLDRLRVTVPGMKKFLEEGNWLGQVPRGYDHCGPRVKGKYSEIQKITINSEGKILQKAWQWKLQGEQSHVIQERLEDLGLKKLNRQFMSKMWRNPFYCGISSHKMLDGKVIYGNWEKLISEEDFLIVQHILKTGNRQCYKPDKANPERPLNAFIYCIDCGGKMCGYEVKKKNIHYYKCQQCKNATINANTTKGSKGIGANELFQNFLYKYSLPVVMIPFFKTQLKLTYETLNTESTNEAKLLKTELEKQKLALKTLNRNYMLDGNFDKEIYGELKAEMEAKIHELTIKLENTDAKISNLDKYIQVSEVIATNINKYWASDSLETKKRVQELVFPEGLLVDVKKREYLTKSVNCIFALCADLSRDAEGVNEKRQPISKLPLSSVAGE